MDKRFWIIIAILVVVAVGVGEFATHRNTPTKTATNSNSSTATGSSLAPTALVNAIAAIPRTTLDSVGKGTLLDAPKAVNGTLLTENQKPEVFYEGAEYCPYCATERWSMAVALDRFGSFSNLGVTHSSSTDVYPNTQTLSFYNSTYSSPYISFAPVELYTNIPEGGGYKPLQTPTTAEQKIANTYDSAGSIPFIDFGNKYVQTGVSYDPSVLQGKSASQIATALSNPNSPIAKGADGTANIMIAAICKLTNNQPSTVCDSTIQGLESDL